MNDTNMSPNVWSEVKSDIEEIDCREKKKTGSNHTGRLRGSRTYRGGLERNGRAVF